MWQAIKNVVADVGIGSCCCVVMWKGIVVCFLFGERGLPMYMKAQVLSGEVQQSTFYDQATGAPRKGYTVKLKVLDDDTDETYSVQLSDGFPHFDEMKELRRQGAAPEVLEEVAGRLSQALPAKGTLLGLEVLRFKGKSAAFITLVCRFAQVAESVA